MKILLYGANGYTAQLMLPLMGQYGLTAILAGRSEEKIAPLARDGGFEYRIFDLSRPEQVDQGIQGCAAVLHCAGPFLTTARPMMEACIRNKVHYLDITGEITVFELAHTFHDQAVKAGITLLPGSGFDVVPTDCLALRLRQLMPDATHLSLAFAPVKGGLSHGTATTMANGAGEGGMIRKNGQLTKVPLGHRGAVIDFGEIQQFCMTIPWGDVSTAYYTTGIPNIEVLTAVSPRAHAKLRWQWAFNWFLRLPPVKAYAKRQIAKRPAGPSPERRAKAFTMIWGEVTNAQGDKKVLTQKTPDGYTLTAHTALWLAAQLAGGKGKPGFYTPAGLFGDRITELAMGG